MGVHIPEFEFEKSSDNVLEAIKQFGIHYPVAQDNDYQTWNAYSNQYWPAEYLIDASGNISPETYLGSARMLYLYPNGRVGNGTQNLTHVANLPINAFSFG